MEREDILNGRLSAMAHFLGTLRGSKLETSRLGSKSSGIKTTAASWSGAVITELRHIGGRDEFRVVEIDWPSKIGRRIVIDWTPFGKDE